jgi:ATP-dependent DNA helicase RecG
VRRGKHGPEIVHPEYKDAEAPDTQAVQGRADADLPDDGRACSRDDCETSTAQALAAVGDGELPDWLPQRSSASRTCRTCARRCSTCTARRRTPSSSELEAGRHPAQRRLAFEELLAHQLSLAAPRRNPPRPGLAGSPRRESSPGVCSPARDSR